MSETLTCEKKGADAEAFIASVAVESAQIVAQQIPAEYREVYLGTYAAGLALGLPERGGLL